MDLSIKAARLNLRRDLARLFKARVEVCWYHVAELALSQNADSLACQNHWLVKEAEGKWAKQKRLTEPQGKDNRRDQDPQVAFVHKLLVFQPRLVGFRS